MWCRSLFRRHTMVMAAVGAYGVHVTSTRAEPAKYAPVVVDYDPIALVECRDEHFTKIDKRLRDRLREICHQYHSLAPRDEIMKNIKFVIGYYRVPTSVRVFLSDLTITYHHFEAFQFLATQGMLVNKNSIIGALYGAIVANDKKAVLWCIEEVQLLNYDRKKPLVDLVVRNDLPMLKWLAEIGYSIKRWGSDAFITAAQRGNLEIAKWLAEKDVHANYDLALQEAAANGQLGMVVWLVTELGADIQANNNRALLLACENNHVSVARWLLRSGANIRIDLVSVIRKALQNNYLELVQLLVEFGVDLHANDHELFQFISSNNFVFENVVDNLLQAGVGSHVDKQEIFKIMCARGYLKIATRYFDSGCIDIHANDDEALRCTTKNRPSSLAVPMIQWLLKHGANIHANNDEVFRNLFKQDNFWIETAEYLVEMGANIQANDQEALYDALRNVLKDPSNWKQVRFLVLRGANIGLISIETRERVYDKMCSTLSVEDYDAKKKVAGLLGLQK